ncbi:hypothetical protein [Streptacidiphilus sp. EB129]|uniref:hypothetical protein n=1 Tax=Streptacidiphilus sp. EB129 TaxID=3156262 RepID=UPI003519A39A
MPTVVQLDARPDEHALQPESMPPAPPGHARSRPVHWIGTAAGLAAVIAAALAAAPAGASVATVNGPHAVPAAAAPNPAGVALPLDCAGLPVKIDQSFSADLTGNGDLATVVAARCDSPTGTPPDGVYVITAGAGGAPRISAVLVRPGEGLNVRSMSLGGDGSVHARIDGYSSPAVPRCCADLHETYSWTRSGTDWSRTTSAPSTQV